MEEGGGGESHPPLLARLGVQLKKKRWRCWRRGERERKTVLIDTWEVNPLAMVHREGKEPHKRQRSVTGKRWRQEKRGWRRDRDGEGGGEERSFFERTAVVLETQCKLILGGFTEYISLFESCYHEVTKIR